MIEKEEYTCDGLKQKGSQGCALAVDVEFIAQIWAKRKQTNKSYW
jgi:hypothetical protein